MSENATFEGGDAAQLAVVERSGFTESRHLGSAIVLGPDGSAIRTLGRPSAQVFPRSALKPFQALTVMNSGVALEGALAVIATASHSGTAEHVALVRELLARGGVPDDALACPAAEPRDRHSRETLIRSSRGPAPIYMNCSGKHASMLLACSVNGWDHASYLDPAHPLQQRIRDVVERLSGEKVGVTGVDGCGAPVHSLTLEGLARGIQKITAAQDSSPFALFRNAAALTRAVLANGWVIAGPKNADTIVIDELGVFSKGGAEGVKVMSAPNGTTVALKVLDGSSRAATIVALQLLVDAGALDGDAVEALGPQLGTAVAGGGARVGSIRAALPDR